MTTPNLDATQDHWLESLTGFTFSIEYQKDWDNAATNVLSQVTMRQVAETVKSILDAVTMDLTGEDMITAQGWLRLMKRCINKSGKLLS